MLLTYHQVLLVIDLKDLKYLNKETQLRKALSQLRIQTVDWQ